jgi:hypothetical protein
MHSIITSEKQIVLHPCHKRNFITITQVVKIICEIIGKWNSGGTEFPSHNAQNLSNYEVSQIVLNVAANATHEVLFSHSPVNTGCEVCPADELPLLVRPDFFRSKEISYFLMQNEQTIEEALLEQFKTLSTSYQKVINHIRNESNCNG